MRKSEVLNYAMGPQNASDEMRVLHQTNLTLSENEDESDFNTNFWINKSHF